MTVTESTVLPASSAIEKSPKTPRKTILPGPAVVKPPEAASASKPRLAPTRLWSKISGHLSDGTPILAVPGSLDSTTILVGTARGTVSHEPLATSSAGTPSLTVSVTGVSAIETNATTANATKESQNHKPRRFGDWD